MGDRIVSPSGLLWNGEYSLLLELSSAEGSEAPPTPAPPGLSRHLASVEEAEATRRGLRSGVLA